jgi:hypothetical protein
MSLPFSSALMIVSTRMIAAKLHAISHVDSILYTVRTQQVTTGAAPVLVMHTTGDNRQNNFSQQAQRLLSMMAF